MGLESCPWVAGGNKQSPCRVDVNEHRLPGRNRQPAASKLRQNKLMSHGLMNTKTASVLCPLTQSSKKQRRQKQNQKNILK